MFGFKKLFPGELEKKFPQGHAPNPASGSHLLFSALNFPFMWLTPWKMHATLGLGFIHHPSVHIPLMEDVLIGLPTPIPIPICTGFPGWLHIFFLNQPLLLALGIPNGLPLRWYEYFLEPGYRIWIKVVWCPGKVCDILVQKGACVLLYYTLLKSSKRDRVC